MLRKTLQILSIAVIGFCFVDGNCSTHNSDVNDIIKLLKAKVGEEVIKAHIVENDMVFELSTKDIVNLAKAGASNNLLKFMITGGSDDFPFELEEEYVVKRPTVYKHLAIYPVFRNRSIDIEEYITLDEAQKAKVIIITEKKNASVPTVVIKNKAKKPIYIMAGEIIIGGKQDRMVSFDVLIPSGQTVEVEVKCVEHGRWHGKSAKFEAGSAVGGAKVRGALQFGSQQEVWAEVDKACKKHDVKSTSGTYDAILSSEEIKQKINSFLDALKKTLNDDDMAGMIMALNGELVCVDIFANPKFFAKVKDNLLEAYVLDAIGTEETSHEIAGKQEILSFFKELKNAQTKDLKKYRGNANVELESPSMIGNESRDKDGNLQHMNLYKK